MILLIYILSLFGFTYVVGQSAISLPFRQWMRGTRFSVNRRCPKCRRTDAAIRNLWFDVDAKTPLIACAGCKHSWKEEHRLGWWFLDLIECPACLSTWCGIGIAIFLPETAKQIAPVDFYRIVLPLLSAGSSALLGLVTGLMHSE